MMGQGFGDGVGERQVMATIVALLIFGIICFAIGFCFRDLWIFLKPTIHAISA